MPAAVWGAILAAFLGTIGVIASPGISIRFSGWVQISSTAGYVTVQWAANNTGAGTGVTRHANSYLSHRIP